MASPFRRACAVILDAAFVSAALLCLSLGALYLGLEELSWSAFVTVVVFAVLPGSVALYYAQIFWALHRDSQTLGQRLAGIEVLSPGARESFVRYFLGGFLPAMACAVLFYPLLLLLPVPSLLSRNQENPLSRRLGILLRTK